MNEMVRVLKNVPLIIIFRITIVDEYEMHYFFYINLTFKNDYSLSIYKLL